MNDNTPALNSDIRIREAFILIAFRIIIAQLLIGITYFLILEWAGISTMALGWERLGIFTLLQGFQIILSLYFFLRWFHRCYEINEKEVICHSGVFTAKSDYYSLERLESVNLNQSVLGMIFGYGTLKLTMFFSDHRDYIFIKNIRRPRKHMKALQNNLKSHSNGTPND